MSNLKTISLLFVVFLGYSILSYISFLSDFYASLEDLSEGATRTYPWTNFIYPVILSFALIGILQFILSGYRKTVILRLSLLYNVLRQLIFWTSALYNSLLVEGRDMNNFLKIDSMVNIVYFVFCIYSLRILQARLIPQIHVEENGDIIFDEVNRWHRFFHRLFDLIAIITLYYLLLQLMSGYRLRYERLDTYFIFAENKTYIPLTIFGLLYYLMSEGIFNTSIGKIIMGNIVVSIDGQIPSLQQRLTRSLARLIPFEALSYLFAWRGWHDRIPDTYVVKAERAKHNEFHNHHA